MARGKKPEPLAKKRRQLFDETARLAEVDGDGSDKELGPFLVGEAATMLDLLDPAAGTDGLSWFDRANEDEDLRAEESTYSALIRFEERHRMLATFRTLFRHAVYLACLAQPVKNAVSRRDSWIAMGIRWDWGHNAESNAHCLFCGDNLATLGERRKRKEAKIPAAFVAKFDKHTQTCAMRYLLLVRAQLTVRSEPTAASTDRGAAEVST